MSKKEIKLHMGFMDENGDLVEIPENIQKHIEAREKYWFNKIKEIDAKCGVLLQQLALTEKALELACEYIDCDDCPLSAKNCDSWIGVADGCAKAISKNCLERAKEMMKSE